MNKQKHTKTHNNINKHIIWKSEARIFLLVSSCSISNKIVFISFACCIPTETQEGRHVHAINMLCAVCVTSQVELCQQVLGNFLLEDI